MMKNDVLKGSVLIILAACCYGMLGTFVKMSYLHGFTIAEVTISQFSLGSVGLFMLSFLVKNRNTEKKKLDVKSIYKLIISGMPLGLTSIFYYMSVKYISVSIAIVLLVQAVWMSLVLEIIVKKKQPQLSKIVTVIIILSGTILATNILHEGAAINWKGFLWGILAAFSYTATMFSSNHVEPDVPFLKRSFLMITGGLLIVLFIFHSSLSNDFSLKIFISWGLLVSLFGTILPPILFTKGMPLTGIGLGAIFTSLEIPVSIICAHFLLNESVNKVQWIGVLLILLAVVFINIRKK
jgi:drug/metabolite transporter (DMT)-like permease